MTFLIFNPLTFTSTLCGNYTSAYCPIIGGRYKIKNLTRGNTIYVSLDIDAVDPSFAPGIGCVAPGGLSSTEILLLIDKLKGLNPIGMDITEFIPKYDINDITGKLIFRIIHEFIAK